MALPRRFLNLIVENQVPGIRSLLCIDLTRHQFFNPTPPPPTIGAGSESSAAAQDSCCSPKQPAGAFNLKNKHADGAAERFQLPDPTFNFRAQAESHGWNIDCFPLAGRKIICVDQSGRAFLFDADTRQLVTMPSLHKPNWSPFSVFVTSSTDEDAEHGDNGGSGRLYVMERNPRSEAGCPVQHSDQFEAFVFHKPTKTSSSSFESWHCQLLPPPPFLRDYAYSQKRHEITSYSVVGDKSSHILISAEDVGTYCLDTASNVWSRVGEWTLPLCGKLEYVPELKLWFGLSAEDRHLAAVDLSAMDSEPPQLVGSWKEFEPRWEWEESQDSQLVNLGSGRFCIARFFEAMELGGEFGNELVEQSFVVLTGVEVKLAVNDGNCSDSGSSKTKLEVATHKSQFHMSNGTPIYAVF